MCVHIPRATWERYKERLVAAAELARQQGSTGGTAVFVPERFAALVVPGDLPNGIVTDQHIDALLASIEARAAHDARQHELVPA